MPPPRGGGISSALLALLVMIALLVWLALRAFLVDMLLGNYVLKHAIHLDATHTLAQKRAP